jgi:hypothetical protein
VDCRVGWLWRSSSGSMTWDVGAVVGASGRARLFRGCKLWAVAGIAGAAMVGCTGGMMTRDWGGCSGGPQAGGVCGCNSGIRSWSSAGRSGQHGRSCGWCGARFVGWIEGIIGSTCLVVRTCTGGCTSTLDGVVVVCRTEEGGLQLLATTVSSSLSSLSSLARTWNGLLFYVRH